MDYCTLEVPRLWWCPTDFDFRTILNYRKKKSCYYCNSLQEVITAVSCDSCFLNDLGLVSYHDSMKTLIPDQWPTPPIMYLICDVVNSTSPDIWLADQRWSLAGYISVITLYCLCNTISAPYVPFHLGVVLGSDSDQYRISKNYSSACVPTTPEYRLSVGGYWESMRPNLITELHWDWKDQNALPGVSRCSVNMNDKHEIGTVQRKAYSSSEYKRLWTCREINAFAAYVLAWGLLGIPW